MSTILDPHLNKVVEFCRRYGVSRLELFGSATTEAFDRQCSDLDCVVEFDESPADLFKRCFSLKESLEALYDREVDLVMIGAMENSYFESLNKTRQLLYAREDSQAA